MVWGTCCCSGEPGFCVLGLGGGCQDNVGRPLWQKVCENHGRSGPEKPSKNRPRPQVPRIFCRHTFRRYMRQFQALGVYGLGRGERRASERAVRATMLLHPFG
jgi:hypothetical protein